jgi:aspartyl-tRNA(Asn)/glutamyl-tRNA(Gln) amidotransferase subunit A
MAGALHELSLAEAADAIRDGKLSPVDLVEDCLRRIALVEPAISAFATITAEAARAEAKRAADAEPHGPLHGVPVAVKDLIDTAGVATEGGCAAFAGRIPTADATVVSRLKTAGAIVVGKTHTHEVAYGLSTPQSRNPWDTSRMTGGSSGGSAAALAAREIPGALGSDTGGSVRNPAAYCGVTGLKTTFGLVPKDRTIVLSWSYDTIGPMARSARDCAILLQVIAGRTPEDPASVDAALDPAFDFAGLRVGIAENWFSDGVDAEVLELVEAGVRELAAIGQGMRPVRLPNIGQHAGAGTAVVFAEASQYHRTRMREAPHLFTEETRGYLEAGTLVPAVDYIAAQQARRLLRAEFEEAFGTVDVIATPVTPCVAPPHGATDIEGVPLIPATTPFTFPVNGVGLPAIALPCGFSRAGLPVGMQLVGPAFSDLRLTTIGDAFQQLTNWHLRAPEVG